MTYCNVFIFKDSNSTDNTLLSVTEQVWDSSGAGAFSVSSIKGDTPPPPATRFTERPWRLNKVMDEMY